MKVSAIAMVAALMATSAAQAQSSRAYRCTIDADGSSVSIKFGTGEIRYRSRSAGGDWGENICDETSDCGFEGPDYIGEGRDFVFDYNSATGRFSFTDFASQTRKIEGTCQPE